jgi:Tol biopolymer transport system component
VEVFSLPVWSPDGRKLLISHTIQLDSTGQCCLFRPAIVNPDGSAFSQLTTDYDCPVWTPDQHRLLCGTEGDQPGVFSIRASDGGDPVRLTTYPYGPACNACDDATDVSPDGRRFVFLRFKGEDTPNEQVALFVENIDGTGLRQITPYGLAEPHEIASAQWSPNGQEIISETTQGRLFTVRPDGTHLTQIHLATGTDQYFAFEPDWSPDGNRIVFCMFINGQEDIYTAQAHGADVVQVTNTPDFKNGPDWGRRPSGLLPNQLGR